MGDEDACFTYAEALTAYLYLRTYAARVMSEDEEDLEQIPRWVLEPDDERSRS